MDIVFTVNLEKFDYLLDQGYRFMQRIPAWEQDGRYTYVFGKEEYNNGVAH